MFRKHVIGLLTAYHHGELSAGERSRIEAHLRTCAKCRVADEENRFAVRLTSLLSESNAPGLTWSDLQRRASQVSVGRTWSSQTVLAGAIGAIVAVAVLVFALTRTAVPDGPSWEVTGVPGTSRLRPGEALQTNSSSEAQIKIADIGQLTIDPNTKIRLLVTQAKEHRIALDHGKLEARTWAPPRLFIVETPLANAVDLGCRYTLEVEEDGSSLLHVTLGLVALEGDKRETVVPAGAFCRTRRGGGTGTPYFEDASVELQAALDKVDSSSPGPFRTGQLEAVLRESRVRDALSLWHLIPRLDAQSRGLVFDRLSQLLPPPPDVTRDGIIALDPKMLDTWKKVVSQLWQ